MPLLLLLPLLLMRLLLLLLLMMMMMMMLRPHALQSRLRERESACVRERECAHILAGTNNSPLSPASPPAGPCL